MTHTIDGITAYLVSLRIYGCGEVTCRRVAEQFGDETFNVCQHHPERLTTLAGIGQQKADALHQAMLREQGSDLTSKERKRNRRLRELRMFFGSHDIKGRTLNAIIARYGDRADEIVTADPYRLTEIDGFAFDRCDQIAAKLGISGQHPVRLRAALLFLLQTAAKDKGHTCLPAATLTTRAAQMLRTDEATVQPHLDDLTRDERVILTADGYAQLPNYYWAERRIATTLRRLQSYVGPSPSEREREQQQQHRRSHKYF